MHCMGIILLQRNKGSMWSGEGEIKLRDFVMFQTKYRVRRLTMRQIVQCSRACKSVNIGTLDGKQSTFNKELNKQQLEKFEVKSGVDRDTGWIKSFSR